MIMELRLEELLNNFLKSYDNDKGSTMLKTFEYKWKKTNKFKKTNKKNRMIVTT